MKRWLVLSGLFSVVVYTLHVVIGGWLWHGYSHLHQPISDLTGSGAPNRLLMLVFTNIYGCAALLFAIVFAGYARQMPNRVAFAGSIAFVLLHVCSIAYSFFPEDIGTTTTFNGAMHIAVTIAIVPFTIATPVLIGLGFRRQAGWGRMVQYSFITGGAIVIIGAATAIFFAKKLPYFGLVERINIGLLQCWTAILSIHAFRSYNKLTNV